ncbi:MAG: GNAT family N-acetyltransferase [Alphaproteobacteria bacterium]|nr:GNAT family N-acetyltransferase [Alphaproteobacteria bacterium]
MSDGTPFAIVNAATVPAASVCDAFNAAFSDYLLKFPVLDAEGWRAFVRRQGIDVSLSSVACRYDAVVAFATITPRPLQRSRIAVMGARPTERGSGAAARLLDEAIAASEARGDRWIELEAFAQNERAVRLYRSRGFESIDEMPGFIAAPSEGLGQDADVIEVSNEDAAAWACAFDREHSAYLPWQVGGEAILAAVVPLRAWRLGSAQLVFQVVDGATLTVQSLIDRDSAQRDALRLVAAWRHRYPAHTLRAPQIQRASGPARAFTDAGWTRQPLHQLLMRRPFRD